MFCLKVIAEKRLDRRLKYIVVLLPPVPAAPLPSAMAAAVATQIVLVSRTFLYDLPRAGYGEK